MTSVILATAARFLLPVMMIFSLYLLLRGEDEPGGGFSAGVVAAAAVALYAIALGAEPARRLVRVDSRMLIGVGLLLAVGAGIAGLIAGDPFLSALHTGISIQPGFSFSTPFMFDVGVYLIVIGVVLTIVISLREEQP